MPSAAPAPAGGEAPVAVETGVVPAGSTAVDGVNVAAMNRASTIEMEVHGLKLKLHFRDEIK